MLHRVVLMFRRQTQTKSMPLEKTWDQLSTEYSKTRTQAVQVLVIFLELQMRGFQRCAAVEKTSITSMAQQLSNGGHLLRTATGVDSKAREKIQRISVVLH